MSQFFQAPDRIVAAYENGLPGWQFDPDTMDALMADRKALLFAEAAPHLAGAGKGKMALLWRSREKYDPGAFGQESQTTGDCVSHGSRNAREVTRSVEIHIKREPEEFFLRTATEPTYGARGHGGQGMDPAKATRFENDFGFLFRQKYPFVDLSVYDSRIGSGWGRSGVPEAVRGECRKHNVGQWIAPRTADEVKDLLYSGYALHSGQNFGVRSTSDSRGIAGPVGLVERVDQRDAQPLQAPLHRQGRTRDHAVVPVVALQPAVLRGVRVLVDVADPIGVFLCVVQDAGVDILVMRMRFVDFERDGDSASFFHQSTASAKVRKRQKHNFLRDYTIEMLYRFSLRDFLPSCAHVW